MLFKKTIKLEILLKSLLASYLFINCTILIDTLFKIF